MGGSGLFGGGGSKQASSTTTTGPQNWISPYAKSFLGDVSGVVNADLAGGVPQGILQQVAPFSNLQQQGLGFLGANLPGIYGNYGIPGANAASLGLNQGLQYTPAAQQAANVGANQLMTFARGGNQSAANPTLQAFANGQFAGPNPYLQAAFNASAAPLISNYQLGTEPALMAQFQQAGAFNSPGFAQAQGLAQQGLGQSLASLGTGLAYPAYEQGMQNMLTAGQGLQQNTQFNVGNQLAAAQGLPAAAMGMFGPASALQQLGSGQLGNAGSLLGLAGGIGQGLYGAGQTQQQQAQNQLNATQANATQNVNWPFALLSQLGGALGQANLGGGQTTSTGPAPSGGK